MQRTFCFGGGIQFFACLTAHDTHRCRHKKEKFHTAIFSKHLIAFSVFLIRELSARVLFMKKKSRIKIKSQQQISNLVIKHIRKLKKKH